MIDWEKAPSKRKPTRRPSATRNCRSTSISIEVETDWRQRTVKRWSRRLKRKQTDLLVKRHLSDTQTSWMYRKKQLVWYGMLSSMRWWYRLVWMIWCLSSNSVVHCWGYISVNSEYWYAAILDAWTMVREVERMGEGPGGLYGTFCFRATLLYKYNSNNLTPFCFKFTNCFHSGPRLDDFKVMWKSKFHLQECTRYVR